MNIHIVYANVGAINNPQAQIIGAEYQFICQSELRFQVQTDCISDTVSFVVSTLCRVCCNDTVSSVGLAVCHVS